MFHNINYKNPFSFLVKRKSSTDIYDNPKKLKQDKHFDVFTRKQIEQFILMTENDHVIHQFLEYDRCCKFADKYLLAMVFVYFIRAKIPLQEYNRANFFAALHLAHDIEEDEDDFKRVVMNWGLSISRGGPEKQFLKERDQIWLKMNYRAVVSDQCWMEVMNSTPDCPLWKRERSPAHVGYGYSVACPNCVVEEDDQEISFYHTDLESIPECDETEDSYSETSSVHSYITEEEE